MQNEKRKFFKSPTASMVWMGQRKEKQTRANKKRKNGMKWNKRKKESNMRNEDGVRVCADETAVNDASTLNEWKEEDEIEEKNRNITNSGMFV